MNVSLTIKNIRFDLGHRNINNPPKVGLMNLQIDVGVKNISNLFLGYIRVIMHGGERSYGEFGKMTWLWVFCCPNIYFILGHSRMKNCA
jgi:hypothetical protein